MGSDDNWKLHKLTRKVRLEVNRQRLKAVFDRLKSQSPDAYYLICAATSLSNSSTKSRMVYAISSLD